MAKKLSTREILKAQIERLQHCAFSEAVAKVLTERGDDDVQPYFSALLDDDMSPNYYPSDVFASWRWQPVGLDGQPLPFAGKFEYSEDELQQITGTEVTIWTRMNGQEVKRTISIQHRDLQPEAWKSLLFRRYGRLAA